MAENIEVRQAHSEELASFHAMEQEAEAREYITTYSLAQHRHEFRRAQIHYLAIVRDSELAGFFILALEQDTDSIEFRRIVVASKGCGTGQRAIAAMENYCRQQLKCKRIWLDVFASNRRGRHVYEKLGYQLFDRGELDGRDLLYLHKHLDMTPETG